MDKLKKETINQIKGISKKMIENLNNDEIFTVYDLLYYFPYRYEFYEVVNINTALDNEKVTVVGQVMTEPVFYYYKKNHSRLTFSISINNQIIKIIAFNRDFLRNKLQKEMFVTITGKFERNKAQITAHELKLKPLENDRIEPVYSFKNLNKTYFLNILKKAYFQYQTFLNDDLPLSIKQQYRLISINDLFMFAHFPVNNEQVKQVVRRVKYEELLKFQLKMLYLKNRDHKENNVCIKNFNKKLISNFIVKLPFQLTNDQMDVTGQILKDLRSPFQMNRLLQGDVGSGKTVVAAIALYACKLSNNQSCLMAPTEILAEQHFFYLKETFNYLNLKIELLTSSTTSKSRNKILSNLVKGEVDILVGTHALISVDVNFNKLGLIIVDEQHRFGVNQRKILKDKGETPDSLFLSATPIPRTLALTAFGDMDVSSIKEMPKGRKLIKTYVIRTKLEKRLLKFIDEIVQLNQQVYVVTPLIEESEKIDLQNALEVYEKYKNHFSRYKVGLLHGKMTKNEKEAVMNEFQNNELQILISTTVVEVGVNVLNATLMIIIDAHRFGLAQLHQLRGRVGRSNYQSYCILVSDYENDKTMERLELLTKTYSGFEIAEADLRLRGPGDFFGSRQSGLPKFKMADIVNDYHILDVARNDAHMIISSGELFTNPLYFALRIYVETELVKNNELFD